MDNLTKLETTAAVAALNAVISSAPYSLPDEHPLKSAVRKLETRLEEFNMEEIRDAT
jgi:hypothetical protein